MYGISRKYVKHFSNCYIRTNGRTDMSAIEGMQERETKNYPIIQPKKNTLIYNQLGVEPESRNKH
jgi:hypothetical protein